MRGLSVFPSASAEKSLMLHSLQGTERLGGCLALALAGAHPGALLLYGPLGAGKTTLCRALVAALPGGADAEVSSPSFTICNIYCTEPAVHHFDLYRMQPGMSDEALEESFDDGRVLTIVEWPEHLKEKDLPADGLALRISLPDTATGRRVEFAPLGPSGECFLAHAFSLYAG